MNALKSLALATVSVGAVASASQAATVISAGNYYNEVAQLAVGGQILFDFEVMEALTIDAFALSATGLPDDVADVTFGFTEPTAGMFNVVTMMGIAAGTAFLPGGTYAAGDVIRIIFNDGVDEEVGVSVSFNTAIAPVPLPAAGGMLLFAIAGGVGAAIRKRRKLA